MHKLTELCELGFKYGADKCPQIHHCYTPFYYELLKNRRESIRKVLEVGVGNSRQKKYIPNYVIGASIRMWRDFFPNAQVYGADICPESIFEDDRIKTYPCDERKEEDILNLLKHTGTDIDLVIDDANHRMDSQRFLCLTLMPRLKKGVIYIIEDVHHSRRLCRQLMEAGYDCSISTLPVNENPKVNDRIIIVKHK